MIPTLALIASASYGAARSPMLASSAFATPPAQSTERFLAWRGGGSIGPVDVNVFTNIQLLALALYSVEVWIPSIANRKYTTDSSKDVSFRTCFASIETWSTLVLAYFKFFGGVDSKIISRVITSQCVLCAPIVAYQIFGAKTIPTKEPFFALTTLALLGLYFGW